MFKTVTLFQSIKGRSKSKGSKGSTDKGGESTMKGG